MKYRLIFKALLLFLPAACFSTGIFAAQRSDTLSVYFPFNESRLPQKAQEALDSLSYNEILTPDKDLMIIGYADFPGTNDYNDALSKKRAAAVLAYLKTLGFKQSNIELCIGKGELEHAAADTGRGYAPDRRVDIVLLHKKKKTTTTKTIVFQPAAHPDTPKQKAASPRPVNRVTIAKPAIVLQNLTDMTKLQPDVTIRLNNIYFPSGRHFVTENSRYQLEQLYDVLSSAPGLRIRIEGHVCCVYDFADAFDEDEQTYRLSVNRAKFIYDFLIRHGIAASRLEYAGYGRSRPVIYSEHNEEEAQQNRRVEIRILAR